ncbi:MAG: MATE family efflux transporter [bacterium]|nr:MATE family efflux transporter [bacterium]
MKIKQSISPDRMLGEEKITKLLVKLSVPSVVGMLANALYNLVDTIFIGRGVGINAIGGLAVAFPLQMFIMALTGVIAIGSASAVSRNLGSGNRQKAYQSAGNALLLSIILGLLITFFSLIFLNHLLSLFGATAVLISYSKDYLSVILGGVLFSTFGMTANNIVRAEGRAGIAMATMLLGTLFNIILDPIFIFVFRMGIKGAAFATIISQLASAAFLIGYFLSGKSSLKIRLSHLALKLETVREIIVVGFPSFIRQAGGSIMMIVVNNMLGIYGGAIYISCFGIINRFFMVLFMAIFGIVQGLQPIVGYNYGAGKIKRVKEALTLSSITATLICIVTFLILMIFPGQVIGLFSENNLLIQTGIVPMRLIILAMPVVGFQIIASSLFQATGKAKPALLLGMSRQFLFLIPLMVFLPMLIGVHGIFIAFPAADILGASLTALLFVKEIKKMRGQGLATMSPKN